MIDTSPTWSLGDCAALLVSTALGVFILLSACEKLARPHAFRLVVMNYRLLPRHLSRPVSRTLAILEAVIGFTLLLTPRSPWPLLAAAALILVVTGAVAVNLARGRRYILCGCFGPRSERRLSWRLVLRNLALTATALLAAAAAHYKDATPLSPALSAIAAAAAVAVLPLGITATLVLLAKLFGIYPQRLWQQ